jgi:hypothetical protein
MVRKLTKQSPQKTALYEFLEWSPYGAIGIKHILPVRRCFINRKS